MGVGVGVGVAVAGAVKEGPFFTEDISTAAFLTKHTNKQTNLVGLEFSLETKNFFFQVRRRRCAWAGSRALGLVVGFDADRVFCMYLVSHVVCLCYPVPLVPAHKTPKKKEN
jgi:hypothetical protein